MLYSSLLVQEARMNAHKKKDAEQAQKMSNTDKGYGRGRGRARSRGHGRGRQDKNLLNATNVTIVTDI